MVHKVGSFIDVEGLSSGVEIKPFVFITQHASFTNQILILFGIVETEQYMFGLCSHV